MGILDKVFLVLFARFRRKSGDSDIDAAWRRASNRVSRMFVLPMAALVAIATLGIYTRKGLGAQIDNGTIRVGQIVAGTIVVLVAVLLDRRFKKYLATPPQLSVLESQDERRLLFLTRGIIAGVFIIACLIAIVWHRAGVASVQAQ